LNLLDQCKTPFGKRLFKTWLCHPLKDISQITDRYNAISDITEHSEEFEKVGELLKSLPDLERSISRLNGNSTIPLTPIADAKQQRQAVYFDGKGDQKKIEMFSKCVKGFQASLEIIETLQFVAPKFKSKVLKEVCMLSGNNGSFPDIHSTVDYFLNLFNHEEAKEAGFVIPKKGSHAEYDKILLQLKTLEKDANDYLLKLRKELKLPSIVFQEIKSQKEKYLIEVPVKFEDIPSYFQFKSSTQKGKTYSIQ
jgi:DNA mismatch repair protein MSH6